MKEGESIFDSKKCHCGGTLRFAESDKERESTMKTISSRPKKNFLAKKWEKLSFKRKSGIVIGLLLVLICAGLLISGLVFSNNVNTAPVIQQPATSIQQPIASTNISQNDSGIEIKIITNGTWQGSYQSYINNQNQSLEDDQNVSGTGNKTFKINGNLSELDAQFTKGNDDGNMLIAYITDNNTIIDAQSTNDSSEWITLQHDFQ